MTTYFLKFDNQEQAKDAFVLAGVQLNENGNLPSVAFVDGHNMAIDVVFGTGTIYAATGATVSVVGDNGNTVEAPVMAPIDGYHVNVTYVPSCLSTYEIPSPEFPKCVFA